MLNVVVASLNPAKIDAARLALAQIFPEQHYHISGLAVPSGVAEQPMSDNETYQGARQRALAAQQKVPHADLWIGMEGGITRHQQQGITFAWIQVLGHNGLDNASRSASLTLPDFVVQAVMHGEELGQAMDRLFKLTNCKQQGGAIGVLTANLLNRRQLYCDTLILALAPLISPQSYALESSL
ncbi:inosine/xanthosine triphosphatase [Oceanisphaera pacifica]|uniref:Inosine/xanthosine triphosphatase n=1 Tax=Oceanisphaera pacifica TaxID=2818389 RepID=A0ABS3NGX0_9GAMM|nr:inosine/xanthosine triphosphatase [Oceanisphaera pacifica]MBO1519816.1 inosine/xanthosine triphosphatase [Oceanisphaera pacifica]